MYRRLHHPLDAEIARAEAASRRRDQIRAQLSRLRRRQGRLRSITRRRQLSRLRAELRALAGVDRDLESLYRRKERSLAEAGAPLAADAAALRQAIERLRAAPDDDLSLADLLARNRRIIELERQRRRLLARI